MNKVFMVSSSLISLFHISPIPLPVSSFSYVPFSHTAYHRLIRAVHGKFDHSIPHRSMEPDWIRDEKKGYHRLDERDDNEDDEAHAHFTTTGSLMHILCTEYVSFSKALRDLEQRGVRHSQYYSSVAEDLACAMAALSSEERHKLEKTDHVGAEYILIMPVGNIRKLDSSVMYGISWMQHSGKPDKRALVEWLGNEHPIISYLNGSAHAEVSSGHLQLSIGFHTPWAHEAADKRNHEEVQEAAAARWFTHDYLEASHHVLSFLDTSSLQDTQHHRHNLYRAKRHGERESRDFVEAWIDLASSTRVSSLPHNYANGYVDSFDHLFVNIVSKKNYNVTTTKDNIDCDYQHFDIEYHKNRIDLKIKKSQQGGDHYLSPGDKNAFCLMHLVRAISSEIAVTSISLTPPIRLLNYRARLITQSGNSYTEPWSALGLDGSGQIVGVSDTGIDENSCFFIDKVYGKAMKSSIENPKVDHKNRKIVEYITYSGNDNDIVSGHGSHVCGSIAGFCEENDHDRSITDDIRKYHGIAPHAKLAFFDIMGDDESGDLFIPYFFQDLFEPAYFAGAKIHSNSWGGGFAYDSFCLDVDDYSYNHPDFLAFFAAGNDGFQGAYTILSPAMAKNVVAVAGSVSTTNSIQSIAGFSAEGPTFDGRIKPDITVPGQSIISAKSHGSHSTHETCTTTVKAGTSMATPIAAGNGALIRQYFKDPKFWGSICSTMRPYSDLQNTESNFVNFQSLCDPGGIDLSGALLKALVIHAGTPMHSGRSVTSAPPDNRQGYGLINLLELLPMPTASFSIPATTLFIDEAMLSSYFERIYTIKIVDENQPLKVTLSWYDPPNLEFAAKVLLHDLDVILADPDGVMYFGNSKTNKDDVAYRDEMNNNEQIFVAQAPRGEWTLKVQSKLLTQTQRQKYALVVKSNGHIDSITESDLSPSFFGHCNNLATNQEASLYTHVSLFDMVGVDGWASGNYFKLVKIVDNQERGDDSIILSGSLGSGLEYDFKSVCLSPGSYYIELVMEAAGKDDGIQLEIAQCEGLYLGPLANKQYFRVSSKEVTYSEEPPKLFRTGSCTLEHSTTAEFPSLSSMMINVTLFEGGGAGWSGAYYSIHSYGTYPHLVGGCTSTRYGCCADGVTAKLHFDGTNCNDDNYGASGLFAGSLEWGYMKQSQISVDFLEMEISSSSSAPYIRIAEDDSTVITTNGNLCFLTMLSVPVTALPELNPIMAFDDAVTVKSDSTAEICAYNLDLDTPIVLICPDIYNNSIDLTFYENSYISTNDFGQSKTSWDVMNRNVFDSSVAVGKCIIDKRYAVMEEQSFDTEVVLIAVIVLSTALLMFTIKTFFFDSNGDENPGVHNASMPLPSRDPTSISVSIGFDDGGSPQAISPRSRAMNPMHESVTIAATADAVAADASGGKSARSNGGGRSIFSRNKSRDYEMIGMKSPIDHRLDVSEHVDLEESNEEERIDEQEITFSYDVLFPQESKSKSESGGDNDGTGTSSRSRELDLEAAETESKKSGVPSLRI